MRGSGKRTSAVVAQKYFRGQLGSPEREQSVRQLIDRVVATAAKWGRAGGYFAGPEDADAFEAELTYLLVHQMVSFNSPVWFNCGVEEHPHRLAGGHYSPASSV